MGAMKEAVKQTYHRLAEYEKYSPHMRESLPAIDEILSPEVG